MTAARHARRRRWQPLTWARSVIAGIELRIAWRDWPAVRAHYLRQYRRADRKALAAEMAALAAERHLDGMTPAPAGAPEQETPRPADPPCSQRGAVRAGAATEFVYSSAQTIDPAAGSPTGAPQAATTEPPQVDAAGLPGGGAPVRPGQPDHLWPGGPATAPAGSRRRDGQQSARAPQTLAAASPGGQHRTWVITQPPPGSPLGYVPVGRSVLRRPDGVVIIGHDNRIRIFPATRQTAPQPALREGPSTTPLRMLPEVSPVRPYLVLSQPVNGERRFTWTDPVEWLEARDRALAEQAVNA